MATVTKDFRIKSGLIVEGTNGTINGSDIITEDAITGGTQTNIAVTYDPQTKTVSFAAENGIADSTTDDLEEGDDNLYFTNQRALDATSAAYDVAGAAAAALVDANEYTDGEITTALSTAQGYVSTHNNTTTGVHGVTGNVVGTSDSQTLTNKVLGSGTSLNSNIDANGNTITDLGAPSSDSDAATKGYVDTEIGDHSDLTTGVHGVTGDVVGTSDAQTLTNKTMGDDLLMDGFQVSGLGTPTQADHAATKSYVDAATEGLHVHESARAATTAQIDLATGGLLEIDDVQLVEDDRVLVKNQSTQSQNGIYLAKPGAWVRADDYNSAAEIQGGDFTFVTSGTLYNSTGWVQLDKVTTLGTDPIVFSQFSGAGTYLAGNGLNLDGNTFTIDETITATRTFASDEAADALQDAKDYADENFVTLDSLPGQLDDYVPLTEKGANLGVATLDEAGQVPSNQLGNVNSVISGLTTDDIAEEAGATNLYFTDARAVSALEAVVPNFTAVEIDSVAKQVAATVSAPTAGSPVTAYAFSKSEYRSAKFLVKIAYSTHTEISEVLLTLDTSDNIAITEYAIVGTNGSSSAISAGISGSNVQLLVTPTNASSTVTVVGTLLI